MILSRVWYVLLGLALAVALYVVYIAAGEYERQAAHALRAGLASDSQTVEWALKIDARRRLDALLAGSLDAALQQALLTATASKDGKISEKSKADARRALSAIHDAIPVDWRADAFFAVDRDGRVIAQLGYDSLAGNDEFELGGYPAVNDALHGWLRDDAWILGNKLYVVAARPVEYDAAQRPAGAIVGLKEVNGRFAEDLAKRTRTSVAFYAGTHRLAAGVGAEGFDADKLDAIGNDLKNVDDKAYHEGRTEARMLTADLGAMYARLPGDAWPLGGGFAVARGKTPGVGPMGFLSNADDKDKANVPWVLLVVVVLLASVVGVGLTLLEHTLPLRELVSQSDRLKVGAMDGLHVARFRGAYSIAAQAINEGIDRAIEKAGGVSRKPADLESILGPTPAQPAMSAFSFPLQEDATHSSPPPGSSPATPSPPLSGPSVAKPPPMPGVPAPPVSGPRPPTRAAATGRAASPPSTPGLPRQGMLRAAPPLPAAHFSSPGEDDATMVGQVPAEVMAQASGSAFDETAEWVTAYQEFIGLKQQCGEPTDGVTFEKFAQKLRLNRDKLIQSYGCKRVRFTVYVKEGRAALKATPVKE
jgi:hypothetical protein